MDITPSNLKLLFQQFDRQFNSMFAATEVCWPLYASEFPSKTKQTVYGWLAQFGGMRKWEGSRQAVDAVGRSYTLTNIPFERTVELDRDDIFFDQYGLSPPSGIRPRGSFTSTTGLLYTSGPGSLPTRPTVRGDFKIVSLNVLPMPSLIFAIAVAP